MSKSRKHLFIKGRVQGVFFRATMQDVAHANNVTGWVKNNYDGSVETVLEGEIENIEKVDFEKSFGKRQKAQKGLN